MQVNRAGSSAEVEGHCFGVTLRDECLRQDVLASVLLHVVEAARPIHDAGHLAGRRGPLQHVPHQPVLDLYADHGPARQGARIVRLAAAGRVERGTIERNRRASASASAR